MGKGIDFIKTVEGEELLREIKKTDSFKELKKIKENSEKAFLYYSSDEEISLEQ